MLTSSHGCTLAAARDDAEPSTPTLSVVQQDAGSVTARLALTWPEHSGGVKTNYRFDIVLYKLCWGWAPHRQTSPVVWTDRL